MAISNTASTPSRKRIVKEKPKASAGAARPLAASSRSTSSSWERSVTVLARTSPTDAPSRIRWRRSAKENSASRTRVGSRSRSGTSTRSKWSR